MPAEVDVSVVIPFFNPGTDIDECLASMVEQTISPDRLEVLLVDDGTTDGSELRVADWVSRYPAVLSMHRIPASGGPARPRNVGVSLARGRYVQFVDSDDTMARSALEHLVRIADTSAADIVVHKISAGGPRNIYHQLFRRNATNLTLDTYPALLRNGTVCKLFRRQFLLDHEVRFPEGDTYIEDQHLCLRTYANARSIALVSDLVCYFHWQRRAAGAHFGDVEVDPAKYRQEIESLLDVVDRELTTPETRFAAMWRYYRGEVLGRLRGRAMVAYADAYRTALVEQMQQLAVTRFPEPVHDRMPAIVRTESRLLRTGDVAGLTELSGHLERLRLHATASDLRWTGDQLALDVGAHLRYDDKDFRFEPDGPDWLIPQAFAPGVAAPDRRWSNDDDSELDIDLATISRSDSALWSTTDGLSMHIDADGRPVFSGAVRLDPNALAGGHRLGDGIWDLRLRLAFSGLQRSAGLTPLDDSGDVASADGSVSAFWTKRANRLALRVGPA
jgi:glycosyltransferase involved in cell wall biosynthesis